MIGHSEVEEIKKLIKNGFDLELISFELDIPIEEIIQYKLESETVRKSNSVRVYSAKEIIDSKNKNAHSKMEQMRERYKKIFFKSNKVEVKFPKELSKREVELINSVITEIEEIVNGMRELSKKERREGASTILAELKKIEDYQLTIDQAEKLHFLMQSEVLEKLKLTSTDKIDYYMNKNRRTIIRKLTEAVDIAQTQTEELEELKSLERKLTTKMQQDNQIVVGAVRSRIGNKISKIIQQKASSDRIRNDVPVNIELIIKELANGTLDIQTADEIIEEEAKKRVEGKPKTRFTLTEEQEKRQILIQIKTVLMEKPEQYHIENPETTIMQIQELCGGELEQAIRTVVKNLTDIKDFERAKEICDKFSSKDKESSLSTYIRRLRNEIRNDEISDIVLKGINMNGTYAEERAYFELIEKGLKMGNVKLGAISLGKSQDGLRTITLADIWTDENQKEKSR